MYSKKWSGVVNHRADSCGEKKSQCLSPITCANLSVNQTYGSQAGARTHEGDSEEFKQRSSAQHIPDSDGDSDPPDVVPNPDGAEEGQFLHSILEEDIETLIDRPFSGPELLYAETAVTIGVDVGALADDNTPVNNVVAKAVAKAASPGDLQCLSAWEEEMSQETAEEAMVSVIENANVS